MTAGGYIVAESEITVSSKVAGRIATLHVREGDLVKKDQLLIKFNDAKVKAMLDGQSEEVHHG